MADPAAASVTVIRLFVKKCDTNEDKNKKMEATSTSQL